MNSTKKTEENPRVETVAPIRGEQTPSVADGNGNVGNLGGDGADAYGLYP